MQAEFVEDRIHGILRDVLVKLFTDSTGLRLYLA